MIPCTRFPMLAAALVLAISTAALPARAAEPDAVVTAYHDALLKALDETTGKSVPEKVQALAPAMTEAFDFTAMIKTAAGSAWRSASPKEQDRLLNVFRRLSIATNAVRFAALGSEAQFETLGVRDGPRGLKLVDSRLMPKGEEPVALTYVTHGKGGDFHIIDVLLKGGISELAVRASEYRRIVQDGGIAALQTALDKQLATLLGSG